MLKGKTLNDYTNLSSPDDFKVKWWYHYILFDEKYIYIKNGNILLKV